MNTPSMQRAGSALDNTRKMASDAMERAGEHVRELGSSARDLGNRGWSSMAGGASVARERLGGYANATTRYVAEQPLKSAMIAAAVGAAVAAVVMVVRSQRRGRNTY